MKIFEFTIFGITIAPTYYALMYIFGFVCAWFFMKKFFSFKKTQDLDDLFFLIWLGVVLGWRLGYILFYNLDFYLQNPTQIIAIWQWWMSFHGGLLGVIFAVLYFCKKHNYNFWNLIDYLAIITPIGLAFGRFGNYLNNELYGFSNYNSIFAMQINGIWHFPSPLLELLLEWIILFLIQIYFFRKFLNWKKIFKSWFFSWNFLLIYGISRIIVEFFRLPDSHIGYLFGTNFATMWMIYSLPMVFFGIYLILRR